MVALGDLASIECRAVEPTSLPGETPYLGLEHIECGGRIVSSSTIGEAKVISPKFRFSSRHVLYGKLRPSLAKICLPTFGGVCSTDLLPIRTGALLDRDYLAHYLAQPSIVEYAASLASGINLPRIAPGLLASFAIPLAPLDEQRRIGASLRCVSSLRSEVMAALQQAADLKEAAFRWHFAAQSKNHNATLGDLATISSGITKGRKTVEQTSTVPYLAVANVQAGFLDLSTVKTIDATRDEIERYALVDGDIVLTEGGDADKLGRGTVWRQELTVCLHQNHIFRVRLIEDHKVLPQYISAYLASGPAKRHFLQSAKQTTGIASINKSQLSRTPVHVPPLIDQQRYLRVINRIGQHCLMRGGQLARFDELLASLRYRAFRGEL